MRSATRGRGGRGAFTVANAASLRTTVQFSKTNAVRRLMKDLKEIKNCDIPTVGVAACPLDDDLFVWHGNIRGPPDSVYKNGVFHIEIRFPENYPVAPPSITVFASKDLHKVHRNVFGDKICLDLLERSKTNNWYEGWNSAYTVESILI